MNTDNTHHTELYRKHRPTKLEQVIGQDASVKALSKMIEQKTIPHVVLFTGPSGCGKTTLARILRDELDCGNIDFNEVNCADFNGIEVVRSIRKRMSLSAIDGKSRVWLIDEAHELTTAAQNAFLKILEDTPPHVYFMLATTEPQKLKRTVITRCTSINLKSISSKQQEKLIKRIAKKEGMILSDDVIEKIVDVSDGSARQALVLLHQIKDIESEEDQLENLSPSAVQTLAIEIFRSLMSTKTKWSTIAALLRTNKDDPEGVRRLILACARNTLLSGGYGANRAYVIIDAFAENYFSSGSAGLAANCFEVVSNKE